MGILVPALLGLLAAVPLFILLSVFVRRSRPVGVSSNVVWRRVAKQMQNQPSRKVDWLTLGLCMAFTLAVVALAQPFLGTTSKSAKVTSWIDDGSAALLRQKNGEPALAIDIQGPVYDFSAHPRRVHDEDDLASWIASRDEEHLVVVSPQRFGFEDPRLVQVTYAADPTSLPFQELSIDGEWVYALPTNPEAEWQLGRVGGETLLELGVGAKGLLFELPENASKALELRTSDLSQGRAFLMPVPAVKVYIETVAPTQQHALERAFAGRLEIVTDAKHADLCWLTNERYDDKPSVIVVGHDDTQVLPELSSLTWQAGAAYTEVFDPALIENLAGVRALREVRGDVLLGAVDQSAKVYPLLVRTLRQNQLATSLDLFSEHEAGRLPFEWTPLFFAALVYQLTEHNLLDGSRYTFDKEPSHGARRVASIDVPAFASPQPGLYSDGVINPRAPRPDHVWTEDLLPELDFPELTVLVHREVGQLIAFVSWLVLIVLALFQLRSSLGKRSAGSAQPVL